MNLGSISLRVSHVALTDREDEGGRAHLGNTTTRATPLPRGDSGGGATTHVAQRPRPRPSCEAPWAGGQAGGRPYLSATLASVMARGGTFHGQLMRPPGRRLKSNWQQTLGSGPQVWGTS